jgi:hypothetical protein
MCDDTGDGEFENEPRYDRSCGSVIESKSVSNMASSSLLKLWRNIFHGLLLRLFCIGKPEPLLVLSFTVG